MPQWTIDKKPDHLLPPLFPTAVIAPKARAVYTASIYHRSRFHFLNAFDNDVLTRLQAVFDDPHGTRPVADLYRTHLDLVSAPTTATLLTSLQFRNRALRNEQCILFAAGHGATRPYWPGLRTLSGF